LRRRAQSPLKNQSNGATDIPMLARLKPAKKRDISRFSPRTYRSGVHIFGTASNFSDAVNGFRLLASGR